MASIIDALVVTLTLDGSSFQRQLGVAQKRLDAMSESMRKTGASGEQMGLGVIKGATGASLALRGLTTAFIALPLAAAAAAAGIAKAFLTVSAAITKADRDILTMTRMTDIPAARMNAIGAVAERYHGSRQGAEQAMAGITSKLQLMRMGRGSEVQDFLDKTVNYGINTRGSGYNGVATTEEFRQRALADIHRRAQQGTAGRLQAYQEGRDLGFDIGTIEAAVTSKNYEGELSRQEELADVTPEGLKSSEAWGQSLSDLDNAWQGAMRKLIEPLEKILAPLLEKTLVPAIEALGNKFKEINWDKLTKVLGDDMKNFSEWLLKVDWQKAADAFARLVEALAILFGVQKDPADLYNLPENDPRSKFGEWGAYLRQLGQTRKLPPEIVSQNEKDIRNTLAGTPGFDPNAQNAVLGGLFNESGFDPTAAENNGAGPGRGLAQWTPPERKAIIEGYLGKPITSASAAEQTQAIIRDLHDHYPAVYAILTDPTKSQDEKSRAFTRGYLGPKETAARVIQDQEQARNFADPGRQGDRAQHPPVPKPPPAPVVHPPELNTTPAITGWNQTADGARHLASWTPDQAAAAANNNNVTIGNVTVHTAATDAAGIARDLHGALAAQFGNPLHLALGANTAVA
jgi:hypothetical protein